MDGMHVSASWKPRARIGAICTVVAALSGCAPRTPVPFPRYSPTQESSTQPVASDDSYSNYVKAAAELDHAKGFDSKMLARTFETPDQRIALERQAEPAIQSLKAAMNKSCHVPYLPSGDRESLQGRLEWSLLGRILAWEIADNCGAAKWDDAITETLILTKFGFDLTGSSPKDASLGFVLIDRGRKAIAPSLDKMDPKQLTVLAEGMKTIFERRPKITGCLESAGREMLEDVQNVQDAFQQRNFQWVENTLGPDSKEPIQYLTDLENESDSKRAAFFDGFAKEAGASADLLKQESEMPMAARAKLVKAKPVGDRPWKRLARHFFGIGNPILAMNDNSCARTEMLILEAEIEISLKTKDTTPADLNAFTRNLTIDPYSGEPFVYRTDGKDYRLYSVGDDLVDNNGDTDETYSRPDLVLERPR